jgi:hypothetical protein
MALKKKAKSKTKAAPKSYKAQAFAGKDLTLINLKVTGKDRKLLNRMALVHAGGNLSAWLRYAGLHYRPKASEVIG